MSSSQTCRVCGVNIPSGFTNCDSCYHKSDEIEVIKKRHPILHKGVVLIKKIMEKKKVTGTLGL